MIASQQFTSNSCILNQSSQKSQQTKLYHQVIMKNYQIIKSLLPKMNDVSENVRQLEIKISQLTQKQNQIERTNQDMHYEMRISQLQTNNKISTLMSQYKKYTAQIHQEMEEIKIKNFQKFQAQLKNYSQKKISQCIASTKKLPNMIIKSKNKQKTIKSLRFLDLEEEQKSFEQSQDDQQQMEKEKYQIEDEDDEEKSLCSQSESIYLSKLFIPSQKKIVDENEKKMLKMKFKAKSQGLQINNKSSLKSIQQSGLYNKQIKKVQQVHEENKNLQNKYQQLIENYSLSYKQQLGEVHKELALIKEKLKSKEKQQQIFDKKRIQKNLELQANIQAKLSTINQRIDESLCKKEQNINKFENIQQKISVINKNRSNLRIQLLQKFILFQNELNNILQKHQNIKKQSINLIEVDNLGCFRSSSKYSGITCQTSVRNQGRKRTFNEQKHSETDLKTSNSLNKSYIKKSLKKKQHIQTLHQSLQKSKSFLNKQYSVNRFNEMVIAPSKKQQKKQELQQRIFITQTCDKNTIQKLIKKSQDIFVKQKRKLPKRKIKCSEFFSYD